MKVLLADDHQLVRDTLAALLAMENDIQVEAVESLPKAISKISEKGAFDLVILDYTMPGMNGLKGLTEALERNSGKPVCLISGTATRQIAEEALELGAAGYLPKTLPAKSFVNAVKFMAMGEKFAPMQFFLEHEEEEEHELARKLTKRELEVLEGLSRGLSNKEIAREIELQEVTIKLHVKTLCRKLDAKNRTHAAMIAKEAGLF